MNEVWDGTLLFELSEWYELYGAYACVVWLEMAICCLRWVDDMDSIVRIYAKVSCGNGSVNLIESWVC